MSDKGNERDHKQQDQKTYDGQDDKKGPSGGNSGAGRSGKEDMGSEKPTTSPDLGSRKPGSN